MPGVKDFAITVLDNLMKAHDAIIKARVNQTHQANKRWRQEDELVVGDMVYLSTENLALLKGHARKLMLKFVGPYEIMGAVPIHPVFHASLLRKHKASDDVLFPRQESRVPYNFGEDNEAEWLVEERTSHPWKGKK
ncbi:hypothetical protein JAAARDRAFT_85535, partial [Jaapia argillacea MUCL 33604]